MALKPKHRREIRDLLRILYDDRVWQPHHTDRLLNIIRDCRSDVAEEIEKQTAADYAAMKREQLAIRRKQMDALHEVDSIRAAMRDKHAKVDAILDVLLDLPLARAMVKQEDGSYVLDPTLIDQKDAKIALSAVEKVLKVSGAFAPTKIETQVTSGDTFELLDAIEAEVEEAE